MKSKLAEALEKYSTREYYLPILQAEIKVDDEDVIYCLLYTSPRRRGCYLLQ